MDYYWFVFFPPIISILTTTVLAVGINWLGNDFLNIAREYRKQFAVLAAGEDDAKHEKAVANANEALATLLSACVSGWQIRVDLMTSIFSSAATIFPLVQRFKAGGIAAGVFVPVVLLVLVYGGTLFLFGNKRIDGLSQYSPLLMGWLGRRFSYNQLVLTAVYGGQLVLLTVLWCSW